MASYAAACTTATRQDQCNRFVKFVVKPIKFAVEPNTLQGRRTKRV